MWFSLFAVVLILAITFYQGLLGLFSAAINFFLAVLAAALAFGLYEDVFFSYLLDRQPDDGRGIVLMAIFIVSLLVLRVIFDLIITENMHFPVYLDRVGGGIFGFLTAMIIIGTLTISIQMLPFPAQWLGFSRMAMFDADSGSPVDLTPKEERETELDMLAKLDMSQVKFVRRKLWFNPDGFTLGLVSQLSDNALSGANSFGSMKSSLLDDLYWARFNQYGQNTTSARKPDAITVQACWELPEESLYVARPGKDGKGIEFNEPGSDDGPAPGNKYLVVRAKVTADGSDDGSGNFRFSTGQVRLVTKDASGRVKSHYVRGVNGGVEIAHPKDKLKELYYRLPEGAAVVRQGGNFDFVFEVPEDAVPWFIEYRRNARAEVRGVDKDPPALVLPGAKGPAKGGKKNGNTDDAGSGDENGSNNNSGSSNRSGTNRPRPNMHGNADSGDEARKGGRVNRYSSDQEGSLFSDQLPFDEPLTNYNADTIAVRSGKVLGGQGRLTAKLDADEQPLKGNESPLTSFEVPSDMRLLQLSVRRLQPGSTLGQAMDFARQLGNVSVKDSDGREYRAVGTWGIATVGRDRIFELVYYDQLMIDGSSAPPKLDVIRRGNMNANYALYYLFHIPPGKKIVRFTTPRSNGEDLTSANLVAPD